MNQDERKTAARRMMLLIAAAGVIIGLYGFRLIFLQLVNGDSFKAQATNTTDYKFTVTAARGNIVDSKGERIASSVTGYNVVLNKLLMGDEDLDALLQKLVGLLGENGESWNDSLLIGQADAAGHYAYTAESDNAAEQRSLAAMKENLGLQQYATADDVMEKLVEDYDLADFSFYWQRILGGIHYEMQLQAFSNVNNFILAENVNEATVATIKENSLTLPGVEIVETSARSYEQGTVLPHVLGRVGKITAEKWKVTDENGQVTYPLKEKGYNMNDVIGISGLESAYEDELRGKDGVETITRNSDGVIVNTALTTVPEPGHTVQLTIDSEFQKAVDQALAKNVEWIRNSYGDSKQASAGAVVVIDVKTGGVLAASNYPSFDQNLYAANYSAYSEDENMPLFNRALQGLYTPGSTYKPSVAVAALDTGLINRYSTVLCNGVYTYYKDYHPKCTRHGHSGNIDVVTAIKWSCNIFFYDVGRRLTTPTTLSRWTCRPPSDRATRRSRPSSWRPMPPRWPTAAPATAPTSSRPSSTPTPARRWKRPSRRSWMSSKTRARPSTWSGKGCWGWPRPSQHWPTIPTPSPARPAAPSAARATMQAAPISTTPTPP